MILSILNSLFIYEAVFLAFGTTPACMVSCACLPGLNLALAGKLNDKQLIIHAFVVS